MLHGLAFAGFPAWSDEEQAAIRAALREMLARACTRGDTGYQLADLICAAAHADQDLTPWLAYLDTLDADADAGIAELAEHWTMHLSAGSKPTLWWWPEDSAAPIRAWLYSDALHKRLPEDVKIAIAWM